MGGSRDLRLVSPGIEFIAANLYDADLSFLHVCIVVLFFEF